MTDELLTEARRLAKEATQEIQANGVQEQPLTRSVEALTDAVIALVEYLSRMEEEKHG